MNTHERPQHRPFEQMDRGELLSSLQQLHGKLRVAQVDLHEARRTGDRDEVSRLLVRLTRLKTAAERAQTELALHAERRRVEERFVRAARERLDGRTFSEIYDAATAA